MSPNVLVHECLPPRSYSQKEFSFMGFFVVLTTQRMFELISATECLKIQNKVDAQNSWQTWVLDQHSSHGSSHTHANKVKCVCDTAGYTTMTNFLGLTGDKTDSLQRQVPNLSETRCFRQLLPNLPHVFPSWKRRASCSPPCRGRLPRGSCNTSQVFTGKPRSA